MTKKCPKCKKEKPRKSFSKDHRSKSGRTSWCKECTSTFYQEWRRQPENKIREQEYSRVRWYNVTNEQYDQMYQQQNGCCVICGKHQSELTRSLNVHHNHTTGQMLALLCGVCNRGLGLFRHNTEILQKATDFQKKIDLEKK